MSAGNLPSSHLVRVCSVLFVAVVAGAGLAALAAPGVSVSPASIDRFDARDVTVTVTGLAAADEVVLEFYVDADDDGVIDAGEPAIYRAVVEEGSSSGAGLTALVDLEPTSGTLEVELSAFLPFSFPYATGAYVVQASVPASGQSATTAFDVTTTAVGASVHGTVVDEGAAGVAGALVIIEPLDETCGAPMLGTFTDGSGAYSIPFEEEPECEHRVVLALKPGYVVSLAGQPHVRVDGSESVFGQTVTMTSAAGLSQLSGQVLYADGTHAGTGVAGAMVVAENDDGEVAMSLTDTAGGYSIGLHDGDWEIGFETLGALTLAGALFDGDDEVSVSVSGATTAPDILLPTVNATLSGTVTDASGLPVSGRLLYGYVNVWPCPEGCFQSAALTGADGSFTMPARGPAGPETVNWTLELPQWIEDEVAYVPETAVSSGSELADVDITHATPTAWIRGTFYGRGGETLENLCLRASHYDGEHFLSARARAGCDGEYALPVVDGTWDVRFEPDNLLGWYRQLDTTGVNRQVSVAGESVTDADVVVGDSLDLPAIRAIEPAGAQAGQQLLLTAGGLPESVPPTVRIDGTAVSVIDSRPDIGRVVVEIPDPFPSGAGIYDITVENPENGLTSDPLCVEILAGSASRTCSISGFVQDVNTGPVNDGLVVALTADEDELFAGAAPVVAGVYGLALPDSASGYVTLFLPAPGTAGMWGFAEHSCGDTAAHHAFIQGVSVSGTVTNDEGDPVEGVEVSVETEAGYFMAEFTDSSGVWSVEAPPNTTVERYAMAPAGSRYVNPEDVSIDVQTSPVDSSFSLSTGHLITGRLVDADGRGRGGEVSAWTLGGGDGSTGYGTVDTCTGVFSVAVDSSSEQALGFEAQEGGGSTELRSVTPSADVALDFPVPIYGAESFPEPDGWPRFGHLSELRAQADDLIILEGEFDAGTGVEVFFDDSSGGTLTGADTVYDSARGVVATRVPAGAASGDLVVSVDGVDAPALDFVREAGTAGALPWQASGTVLDAGAAPVEGALVVALAEETLAGECEPDTEVVDVVQTDASGAYVVDVAAGYNVLLVMPPADASPALAVGIAELADVQGPVTRDFTLGTGAGLDLRVLDASTGSPVPNARVIAEGDGGLDIRVTGADGVASFRLPSGAYEVEVTGSIGSRLVGTEMEVSTGGASLDVSLEVGRILACAVFDSAGEPVGGSEVEFSYEDVGGQWQSSFESVVLRSGVGVGPAALSTTNYVTFYTGLDTLSDVRETFDAGTGDLVLHPALEAAAAGTVEGVVRDGTTLSGVSAPVSLHVDSGEGWPEWASGTESCDDGSFHMKVAAGDYYLSANAGGSSVYYESWWTGGDEAACYNEAELLTVPAGGTVDGLEVDLPYRATVLAHVLEYDTPASGVWVEATYGALGTCSSWGQSDGAGDASISVPVGSGYKLAAEPWNGYQQLCWDGFDGCTDYTPVEVTAAEGFEATFVYGDEPPEVSGAVGSSQMSVEYVPGTGEVVLVFEDLEDDPAMPRVDGYNLYEGSIGTYDASGGGTACHVDVNDPSLEDRGTQRAYALTPAVGATWYLVSAYNPAGESSLGNKVPGGGAAEEERALTDACSAPEPAGAPLAAPQAPADDPAMSTTPEADDGRFRRPRMLPRGASLGGPRPQPVAGQVNGEKPGPDKAGFVAASVKMQAAHWDGVPHDDAEALATRAQALEAAGLLRSFDAEAGLATIAAPAWERLPDYARREIARTLLAWSKAQDGRRRIYLVDEEGETLARQSSFWGYTVERKMSRAHGKSEPGEP